MYKKRELYADLKNVLALVENAVLRIRIRSDLHTRFGSVLHHVTLMSQKVNKYGNYKNLVFSFVVYSVNV